MGVVSVDDDVEEYADFSCAVDLPEDWFGLPLEEDPDVFGRRFAEIVTADLREQLQIELSAEHTADLASDVASFTTHAQRIGATFAAIHAPDLTGPVLAVLECVVVDPEDIGWSRDPDGLAEQMREQDPTVAWSEVELVELSAGSAVRVHEITTTPTNDPEDQRPTVERVMHLLPHPDREGTVTLTMSWTALALTEELTPMADSIASALEITPS